MKEQVAIVAAYRTPIGSFGGTLSIIPAYKLGEIVIRKLLEETGVKGEEVSEVIMGQILTANQGQNPARQASISAGIPKEVPAWIVNQVCGSGLRSVALGYQAILTGQADIVIAGGQENMSLSPHCTLLRPGIKMGATPLEDSMIKDGLTDVFSASHMGITAENVAEKYKISRQEQDEYAAKSQNKAESAQKSGKFNSEITPVKFTIRKEEITFANDEFVRHGITSDALNKLNPAFKKEGTVTAGNASGINDGAAAVMLMKLSEAKKRKLKPLAIIKSFAQAGVAPELMGTGPIPASQKAIANAGWKTKDLDLIEANEAFAAQAIAVNRDMGWDESKVNVNGGAIALGHPIGASGTRILVTLLHEMQRRPDAHKGLATLCVGGGMGVAMCVEKQ